MIHLRKNPNNIFYLQKRIEIFKKNEINLPKTDSDVNNEDNLQNEKQIAKYTNAILAIYETAFSTINPKRTIGNYANLWINYALFMQDLFGNAEKTKQVFERALLVDVKDEEELAQIWIAYAKMEIEHHKSFKATIELLQKATTPVSRIARTNENQTCTRCKLNLHKNMNLWSFYLDILEMNANIDLVCKAYDTVIDLKLCTCQTIVNYAYFLEQHNKIEESFRVFERGIELFKYPVAYELWNIFLPRFVQYYGPEKLERIRDLFDQALQDCPQKFVSHLYVYYGMTEEQFGLTRNAMRIYDRATKSASINEKYKLFLFYIGRAANLYGITATREVFEMAILALPDIQVWEICLMYATIEEKLGEIERARYIYMHGSQFANPAIE